MELHDGLEHRRISRDPTVSDNMLACIVAFRAASPEHETETKSYEGNLQRKEQLVGFRKQIYVRRVPFPFSQFSVLHTYANVNVTVEV